MENQIFIITRRWENLAESIKNAFIYPIADVTKDVSSNPPIINTDSLAAFWLRQIISKSDILGKKKISDFTEEMKLELAKEDIDVDITLNNLINSDDIDRLKHKSIAYLFEELNKKLDYKVNTNFLINIHQLQENVALERTGIFIYHHWLDKQGFDNEKKKEFLPKLREEIVRIILKEEIVDYKINWLLHDTDILNNNYDGLLWFEGTYIKNEIPTAGKTSFHPILRRNEIIHLLPESMQEDNIWCFIHQEELDSFYKNIILRTELDYCQSAADLYNYLVLDIVGIKIRYNILKLLGIDIKKASAEDTAFLINTNKDQLDERIELINKIKRKSIILKESTYNLFHLIN